MNLSVHAVESAVKTRVQEAQKNRKKKGFFSIELAVVIVVAIILMLAYLFKSSSLIDSANLSSAMRDMNTLRSSILIYQTQTKDGKLPDSLDKLLVGVTASQSIDGRDHAALIDPQTRGTSIKDPWGNDYEYHLNADKMSGYIKCTEGNTGGESKVEF